MCRYGVILFSAAVLLYTGCAGKIPPLPDSGISRYGETAATLFGRGEFDRAFQMYMKAISEAERFDNVQLQARYRFNIGRIFYECALTDSADRWFSKSSAMYTELQCSGKAAVAEMYSALSAARGGKVADGQRRLTEVAPRIAPEDEALLATALMYLGLLQRDTCAVNRSGETALRLFRKEKDHHGCGVVYYYRAMSLLMQRKMGDARSSLDSSLSCFSRSPYRYRNWKTLLGHALIAYCEGDREKGDRYYDRAKKTVPAMIPFPDRATVAACDTLCDTRLVQ